MSDKYPAQYLQIFYVLLALYKHTGLVLLFSAILSALSWTATAESLNLAELRQQLGKAQAAGDLAKVETVTQGMISKLGSRAGVVEIDGPLYKIPDTDIPTAKQSAGLYLPLAGFLKNSQWWHIGEDPTENTRKPREVAEVISGSVAAYRAEVDGSERILQFAVEAGDYLLWTQQQAGVGLIPFPATQAGQGKVFRIASEAVTRVKATGQEEQYIRNGWFIDDTMLDPGGLQIDNAMGGIALLELYRVTNKQKYLDGALRAAEWAMQRPVVPNWNYNAFSVELLSEAFRQTGREDFREAASQKLQLGVLPGQLREGPYAGRWFDPHNARANYHFIIVRGLVRYLSVIEPSSELFSETATAIRLAIEARNKDYLQGSVPNPGSALDTLLVLERVLPDHLAVIGDYGQRQMLDRLSRIPIALYKSNEMPISPLIWGRLIERWRLE